jgi:hypothetical protein
LRVDLPAGYSGAVLRTPPDALALKAEGERVRAKAAAAASKAEAAVKTKAKKAAAASEASTRRATRRSQRAGLVVPQAEPEAAVEETAEGGTAEPERDEDASEAQAGDTEDSSAPAVRVLRPSAMFSSFVLWNADIAVDEGKDEYLRTITEWMDLAAEVGGMHLWIPCRSRFTDPPLLIFEFTCGFQACMYTKLRNSISASARRCAREGYSENARAASTLPSQALTFAHHQDSSVGRIHRQLGVRRASQHRDSAPSGPSSAWPLIIISVHSSRSARWISCSTLYEAWVEPTARGSCFLILRLVLCLVLHLVFLLVLVRVRVHTVRLAPLIVVRLPFLPDHLRILDIVRLRHRAVLRERDARQPAPDAVVLGDVRELGRSDVRARFG